MSGPISSFREGTNPASLLFCTEPKLRRILPLLRCYDWIAQVVAFLCEMPEVDKDGHKMLLLGLGLVAIHAKDAQMLDGATPLLAAALQGHVVAPVI